MLTAAQQHLTLAVIVGQALNSSRIVPVDPPLADQRLSGPKTIILIWGDLQESVRLNGAT